MKHHIITYKKGLENANCNGSDVLCHIGYARMFRQASLVWRSVLKCRNV